MTIHPESTLAASGLSVGYGNAAIVKDVDLHIAAGQITALVGPNGCGKSTLLKAFSRILKPKSGRVTLQGKPITSYTTRDVATRLAILPQGPVAPEGLTVTELVAQGRFPHQTLFRQWSAKDHEAVERAMALTDLVDFAERPVHSLSGGQRQRCWLAMVLAQDTPILLLDEPTTFLDLKVQVDLMALLSRIVAEDRRTILLVLHELNLAAAFAERIVMMRDGQIVAEGTGPEVIRPDELRRVFDLRSDVIADPATGRPVCLPRAPDHQSAITRAAE
ncbi:ABC transporter ATP-binding protein [Thalassococcus sp. S3]|uniref:ABC transporter ATP-binding protein n=1 Tax=Thalassococcus sp. S3 TaxID=2017482 RepID=UPI00102472B0|nr:ABC transporter ATP-binding protein [Thalassococcus sp. S3]QBF32542.1 cobalamin/Fe(3+)-siderophore ABC transporter ATP-binding protein [Thalassococcus sp. S3]